MTVLRMPRRRPARLFVGVIGTVILALVGSTAPAEALDGSAVYTVTLSGPATAVIGQSTTYTGFVRIANRRPANDAPVTILRDGAVVETTKTNTQGYFATYQNFSTYGSHTLQASFRQFDPVESHSAVLAIQATPGAGTTATDIASSSAFLYQGSDAPQQGMSNGTIDPARTAVLHGQVRDAAGQNLPGVSVTVAGHPEYGHSTSRADGGIDLVVNGGSPLTLTYTKAGYLPADRTVTTSPRDFTTLPTVVLLTLDVSTTVTSGAGNIQIARGNAITDTDGTRQATLLFPAGTAATMTLPDGTEQYLPTLHVHATEVTAGPNGPLAMPGELPPTSGYTYAVDYTVDEAVAANASTVTFDQPLAAYTDNFIGFPTGTPVPAGFYDRTRHAWIAVPDGIVLKIISITASQADIDVTGDGTADSPTVLAGYGITDAERTSLAGLYAAGKSLWRVPVRHFSDYDYNYPYGPPHGAKTPDGSRVLPPSGGCQRRGSIIGCTSQTLGEVVPVVGTGMGLRYDTSRVTGYGARRSISIGITGATVPATVVEVQAQVDIAGRHFTQTFGSAPNQLWEFQWDGLDVYGRRLNGAQTATIRVGYAYQRVYYSPTPTSRSGSVAASVSELSWQGAFAQAGGAPITSDRTRGLFIFWQNYTAPLGGLTAGALGDVGGWTLTAHHAYDPDHRTLYLGDGATRDSAQLYSGLSTLAGTGAAGTGAGSYSGDTGPASAAGISRVHGLASAPDGSTYLADSDNGVIRKISPAGIISTVAGGGTGSGNGDGGPATSAVLDYPVAVAISPGGALLIADAGANRIRQVSPAGIISTLAGGGTPADGLGDTGPATSAALLNPQALAVAADGTVYIADTDHNRIRRLTPNGAILTVAGGGTPTDGLGDGLPGPQATLDHPRGVAADPDGQVWISDTGHDRLRRLDASGVISTLAGTGVGGNTGDGGPGTSATLNYPTTLALDPQRDAIYLTQPLSNTVRQLDREGILTTIAGTIGAAGFSGDQGVPTTAKFHTPSALTVSITGQLVIADTDNYRLRALQAPLPGFALSDFYVPSSDGSELYQFNSAGRHLRTLDAITGLAELTFGYQGDASTPSCGGTPGQLCRVVDHFGNTTTIVRVGQGTPTEIDAPFGQRTTLHTSSDGYLDQITNAANETIALGYGTGGLLSSFTDARHNTSQFTYDPLGRLQSDTGPDMHATTLVRSVTARGTTVTATTAEGHTTSYFSGTTAAGKPTETITTPDGAVASLITGLDGTITSTGPDGTVRVVSPPVGDPRFGLAVPLAPSVTTTTPGHVSTQSGQTRTVTLADPSNPLSLTALRTTITTNGRSVQTSYTAATRTLVTTSPSGIATRTVYNSDGLVDSSQRGTLAALSYGYDPYGRVLTATVGAGSSARTTSYDYNAGGHGPDGYLYAVTNPLSQTVTYTRDLDGRITDTQLPDGSHVGAGYDPNSNLTRLTPPGRPDHTLSYTRGNLVDTSTPPSVDSTDPSTRFTYNKDHQPLHTTLPGGIGVDFSYDTYGRLHSTQLPAGDITLGYDPTSGALASVAAPGASTLRYGYDGTLLTAVTTDTPVNKTVGYTYGTGQQVTNRTITGGAALTFGYDIDGLMNALGGETLTRDPNGLPSGTNIGTINTSTSADTFGELQHITATTSAATLYDATYTRDTLGRIASRTETVGASTSTLGYGYDSRGRLIDVTQGATVLEHYGYDANSNRTSTTTPAGTISAGYDAQDRLSSSGTATFSYNARGDLASKTDPSGTTSYSYDELGHLTHVALPDNRTLDYTYDGLGRRISRAVNASVQRRYLYGATDQPIALLDAAGTVLATYAYGRNGSSPDLIISGGTTYRVIADNLGSPRLIVNTSTGAIAQTLNFTSFGSTSTDTNPGFQPFGYAGGLADPDTGFVHFGARDYDPSTGRFTTKDPAGMAGSGTNLYAYVGNDPINNFDPTGLSWYGDAWNWTVSHLDPVYPIVGAVIAGYEAYDSGCSVLESLIVGGRVFQELGHETLSSISTLSSVVAFVADGVVVACTIAVQPECLVPAMAVAETAGEVSLATDVADMALTGDWGTGRVVLDLGGMAVPAAAGSLAADPALKRAVEKQIAMLFDGTSAASGLSGG